MAVAELYTGTEAVGATEWSCTTDTAGPDADTTAGTYQVFLDASDMIAGDQLQIRIYEKTRSGDTQRVLYESILTGTMAATWVSPVLMLMNGWDVTLKALAGTITVLWSIRQNDAPSAATILTTAMTESYAADGATMTVSQALYMMWALLAERSIASTTLTAKKLDGSTSAMTFTLDSGTTPTSQTRTT